MSNINDQIMTPDVWGPHGWKFIHYITLGYPEYPTQMQKDKYKAFFLLFSIFHKYKAPANKSE